MELSQPPNWIQRAPPWPKSFLLCGARTALVGKPRAMKNLLAGHLRSGLVFWECFVSYILPPTLNTLF